jgi:hypothetical protein
MESRSAVVSLMTGERLTDADDTVSQEVDIYGLWVMISGPAALMERVWPYFSMWPSPRDGARRAAVELEIRHEPESTPERYTVSHLAEAIASASDVPALITQLQAWLDREVLSGLATDLTPIHAGVVACGDGAIVLPAMSGSGKTSLVAALIQRGARYYSDEVALIDTAGWVLPYPRPLFCRHDGQQRPVLATSLGARIGSGPLPIKSIVAVRYDPHETLTLRPITSAEAVLLLLRHTFVELPGGIAASSASAVREGMTPAQRGVAMWPAIVRAADGASAYTGARGDAADVADRILSLAGPGDRTGAVR